MQIEKYNAGLASRIQEVIEEKGLKQCSVARKAGLRENEFYAMLGNRKIIKPCDISVIAKALDVSVDDLFKTD